jgi:dihydrofolate synthase/folylpolyglutamate synthase
MPAKGAMKSPAALLLSMPQMRTSGRETRSLSSEKARAEIERVAESTRAPLIIANQDWQAYEQHGRLVYQDESGLLDLPLPQLPGRHQIDNAGTSVAALRSLNDTRIGENAIAQGLRSATWPARMQRLGPGELWSIIPKEAELWLDGGHNPSAGRALARAFSELNERVSRPLVLVWGMLNTKAAGDFIAPFAGIAHRVVTLTIPDEENAIPARDLAETARRHGLSAETAGSLEDALKQAAQITPAPRVLIVGSLYLAGRVLARHSGQEMSQVSGAGRR